MLIILWECCAVIGQAAPESPFDKRRLPTAASGVRSAINMGRRDSRHVSDEQQHSDLSDLIGKDLADWIGSVVVQEDGRITTEDASE
ncbi:unnamed protein product [Caenorhabditis auriculariae]|uniref:Uncharacterized protein n=1 Tax=Caenorhabditis auriculariae TaxID=2777116 RepID=A0A8S1H0U2_9PELO|nr:unnamed protein product [Caenorhabditis auriculariae]